MEFLTRTVKLAAFVSFAPILLQGIEWNHSGNVAWDETTAQSETTAWAHVMVLFSLSVGHQAWTIQVCTASGPNGSEQLPVAGPLPPTNTVPRVQFDVSLLVQWDL